MNFFLHHLDRLKRAKTIIIMIFNRLRYPLISVLFLLQRYRVTIKGPSTSTYDFMSLTIPTTI
jgi:hypothetical protein